MRCNCKACNSSRLAFSIGSRPVAGLFCLLMFLPLNGFSMRHLFDEGQILHDLALNV
jgi:hypothetical protein